MQQKCGCHGEVALAEGDNQLHLATLHSLLCMLATFFAAHTSERQSTRSYPQDATLKVSHDRRQQMVRATTAQLDHIAAYDVLNLESAFGWHLRRVKEHG